MDKATIPQGEERYRDIFHSVGVSLWLEDFSEVKTALDDLKARGVEDFRRYFVEHPEFVRQAIDLIKIIDVNNETLKMFGATEKSELMGSLQKIFAPETEVVFLDELLAFAQGETHSASEIVVQTLQGERRHALCSILSLPTSTNFDHVLVSLTDNTSRKRVEGRVGDLLRISEKLYGTRDLNELLDTLVLETTQLVGAEGGLSGLKTPEGMASHKYYRHGEWHPLEYCWPPDQGLPGWLITHKTPYLTNDALKDTQIIPEVCAQLGIRNALSTPIISARGAVLGFFQTNNKKNGAFTNDDQELLLAVSQTAASAIQNVLVYDESRRAEEERRQSAEGLSLALQAARLGDWSWDAETDIVTLSPRAAEIFGIVTGPTLTRTQLREALHEDDRERARLAIDRAIEEHSDYDIAYRVIHPNRKQVWVAAKGRAFYAPTGQVKGMLGIVQDINERKRAEVQLEEERDILETINSLGQMLSAELDLQKLVQALTDAATEITGAQFGSFFYNILDDRGGSYMLYTLSGVPREHFAHFPMPRATELFGPTFRGEGVIRINNVREDPRYGKNAPYEGMPPGHLPVRSYLAVPVISRSGEVLGGLFFGHEDIGVFTKRHENILMGLAGQAAIAMDNARLYEATQKARQEAETANRLKDEFLATVSHELRTPLNAMLGWARMLRGGKLDAKSSARALESIERNSKAQQQIIEDILDVSRIITGKLRFDVSPVEIAPAIEAAVEAVRPTADAKGIRLQVILDSNPNLVLGDSNRLQQIIWNLLSNAIKFTPKGGRVQITLERVNSHIEVIVSDTGQGISKEFLPYVFERFQQADSSASRQYGGLGLGLAIVRHLVELHGGTVTGSSSGLNQGSTFIVKFPLAIMRDGLNRSDQESPLHVHKGVFSGLPSDYAMELSGLKVLVVDDEADARELMAIVLQQCGAEVQAASSTGEALKVLEDWRPDVLISDIGMPGEDGYVLIKKVRALHPDQGGRTPAAALTAYARSEDRLRALAAGYHTHVVKPVEPSELAAVVASLAGRTGKQP